MAGREIYLNTVANRQHRSWTWCARCECVDASAKWAEHQWQRCPNIFCRGTGSDAWPWEAYLEAHFGILEFPNNLPGESQYRPASRPVPYRRPLR
jgi:hypothetical protein